MYKSKLEIEVAKAIKKRAIYEPDKLKFTQPAVERTYIPDWKIRDGVYIEAKGKLDLETRKKMVWVKEQYPDYTFYILFQNAYNKLTKRSKTTYAEWAEKAGFPWAHWPHGIPDEWFQTEGEQVVHKTNNRNRRRGSRVQRKPK